MMFVQQNLITINTANSYLNDETEIFTLHSSSDFHVRKNRGEIYFCPAFGFLVVQLPLHDFGARRSHLPEDQEEKRFLYT